MEDKLLRLVYTFFLGLIIAIFVGMGISTFYGEPKMPDYPRYSEPVANDPTQDAKFMKIQDEYDAKYKAYEKDLQVYNRNVSIISLVLAVAFLVIGLLFERKNQVIANGILMGGIFILIYSIARGFASTDTKYTFIAVSVSLLVVLYLGYRRFSAVQVAPTSSKKRK
jgi:hypothetical protein